MRNRIHSAEIGYRNSGKRASSFMPVQHLLNSVRKTAYIFIRNAAVDHKRERIDHCSGKVKQRHAVCRIVHHHDFAICRVYTIYNRRPALLCLGFRYRNRRNNTAGSYIIYQFFRPPA